VGYHTGGDTTPCGDMCCAMERGEGGMQGLVNGVTGVFTKPIRGAKSGGAPPPPATQRNAVLHSALSLCLTGRRGASRARKQTKQQTNPRMWKGVTAVPGQMW
jgi:hypothetical protein